MEGRKIGHDDAAYAAAETAVGRPRQGRRALLPRVLSTMVRHVLSRSVEDYLKAIYALSEGGQPASTSAIAVALDIQPASVTGMVKRLAATELLEHVPYRGVRLTPKGETEALKVLRRHRIIETYLCERLGFAWDDVHPEAERLEHAASDDLVERMAEALAHPSHDPHGAPIPTSAGEIEATDLSTLADAPPGSRLRIRAVRDEAAAELRAMAADGLVPGVSVRVEDGQPHHTSIEVMVGGNEGASLSVEKKIAEKIFVVPEDQ